MSDLYPVVFVKGIGFGVLDPENYAELTTAAGETVAVICWTDTHEKGTTMVKALYQLFPDTPQVTNCDSIESVHVQDAHGVTKRLAKIQEQGQTYIVDNQPHRGRRGISS